MRTRDPALAASCPYCRARRGQQCTYRGGRPGPSHPSRYRDPSFDLRPQPLYLKPPNVVRRTWWRLRVWKAMR